MTNTVWIHYARPRSRWYELDEAGRTHHRETWAELDQSWLADGSTRKGPYRVRGQSDYSSVEVWTFASPEQAYEYWAAKVEAGYAEWFAFANNLGTEDRP